MLTFIGYLEGSTDQVVWTVLTHPPYNIACEISESYNDEESAYWLASQAPRVTFGHFDYGAGSNNSANISSLRAFTSEVSGVDLHSAFLWKGGLWHYWDVYEDWLPL